MDDHSPKTSEEINFTSGKSNLVEPRMERTSSSFSLASLELLSKYGSIMERLKGKQLNNTIHHTTCNSSGGQKLSTVEIMKIARSGYINQNSDYLSTLINPFYGDQSSISSKAAEDLELFCGESRQPRRAGKVTKNGYPIWTSQLRVCASTLAYKQELPFVLVIESVGIQAILESVASAKRIHLVDLGLRSGAQWSSLMQALAVRDECPLEILKITAVGTRSKETIEETGRRLLKFAEGMDLPFLFNLVMVADMKDLNAHLISLDVYEAVVVHSGLLFMNMIPQPGHLENLIKVIKSLSPIVMVVFEVEANTTSPELMDHFIESLLLYSAEFDSFEDCMGQSDPNRLILENYFRGGIRDIIAFEAEERTTWHMKIDGWRAFFKSFGVVETELSMSSLYQAKLVVKSYACGSSCTLDMDGKSLLVGWKGTQMLSVSAWKFHLEEQK
ncbi:hypothetical protein LguiB_025555 [Lonicera macranthoides]